MSTSVTVFGFTAPMMAVFIVYSPLLSNTGPAMVGVLDADEDNAFGTMRSSSP